MRGLKPSVPSSLFLFSLRHYSSVQFSSVTQSYPTLCNPMDCSTPGLPVYHQILKFTQAHVHWVTDAIQTSHPLSSPFSSCPPCFPESGSFLMSQLFSSGGQSIEASTSAPVLPMNIQGRFPFRVDWSDLLAVQRALKSLLQHHSSKASVLWCSTFFMVPIS